VTLTETAIDQLCINTLRTLAVDTVQKANSGHAGTPMGAAPEAYAIWTRFLKHNPHNPHWPDRDRFVLSAGHASILLYSLLALTGYDLQLEELQHFRQYGSRTPGHPEYRHTPGVEVTTGPLGQGFAMSVGLAMAERFLAATFNRPGHEIVDHYTYGIASDGDMMEGIASEAASLAGTLGLGKLNFIYDSNDITIEGNTNLAFREDVAKRFEAYHWHVDHADGNDTESVTQALHRARAVTDRPSLIIARSTIGFGSPHKAGTEAIHSNALGEEEVRLTKRALDWPEDKTFYVPDDVLAQFRSAIETGRAVEDDWDARMNAYERDYPEDAERYRRALAGLLPEDWESQIPSFSSADGSMATRVASGKVLNAIAETLSTMIGGSADLAPSNDTYLKAYPDFGIDSWAGRNVRYGVRENAMGAIINGMAVHGGIIPYGGTFLAFNDYMRPTVRMSAIMQSHSIFVYTHDSIGLGEDGPTHQPIEQIASLRAMPGMRLIRPADANETAWGWKLAIERSGPTCFALSRQGLPTMDGADKIRAGVERGAYILHEPDGGPDVILMATGSEVPIILDAGRKLGEQGVKARVVSMPCWELFEEQPLEYRQSVLPPGVKARVGMEAASPLGWDKYIGDAGDFLGLDHFGASAPGTELYGEFGLTADAVVACAKGVIERVNGGR
jgi:transketolase